MNINKIKLSGQTYSIQDENACKVVELTQAEYDALPTSAKTSNSLFVITDAEAGDLSNYYTKSETDDLLDTKLDVSAYTPTDQSVISGSTNAVSGGAVYTQLGGLKLQKITQSAYDSLSTKDSSTLYVING